MGLPHEVVVPTVVFTERARHLAKNGVRPPELLSQLQANRFELEAYGIEEARRFAPRVHDDEAWDRLARDAMIAGHVRSEDVLWTTNPSDFRTLGLDEERIVVVPPEWMSSGA